MESAAMKRTVEGNKRNAEIGMSILAGAVAGFDSGQYMMRVWIVLEPEVMTQVASSCGSSPTGPSKKL